MLQNRSVSNVIAKRAGQVSPSSSSRFQSPVSSDRLQACLGRTQLSLLHATGHSHILVQCCRPLDQSYTVCRSSRTSTVSSGEAWKTEYRLIWLTYFSLPEFRFSCFRRILSFRWIERPGKQRCFGSWFLPTVERDIAQGSAWRSPSCISGLD